MRPAARRSPKLRRAGGFLAWLRDAAGNATTETVIMIPVFVAIWGGIWYTHQRYRKAVNMAQFTRQHVWAHAFASCEGDPPLGRTSIGQRTTSSEGFIDGITSALFAEGIAPGFQIDEIEGRRETSLERPSVLGEGTVTSGYNLVVLCNETTQEDSDWFTRAFEMLGLGS